MKTVKREVVQVKFREGKGERYEIHPDSFEETQGMVSFETTSDRKVIFNKDVLRSVHITRLLEDC